MNITKEELERLRKLVQSGMWVFESTGNPHETQFSYCTFCHVVEYVEHHKDCKSQEIMAILDKLERMV